MVPANHGIFRRRSAHPPRGQTIRPTSREDAAHVRPCLIDPASPRTGQLPAWTFKLYRRPVAGRLTRVQDEPSRDIEIRDAQIFHANRKIFTARPSAGVTIHNPSRAAPTPTPPTPPHNSGPSKCPSRGRPAPP